MSVNGSPSTFPFGRRNVARLVAGVLAAVLIVVLMVLWVRRPEQVDAVPVGASDYTRACLGDGVAYTKSRAYEGPGPHGITAVALDATGGEPRKDLSAHTDTLLPWETLTQKIDEPPPPALSLLVCAARVEQQQIPGRSCEYSTSGAFIQSPGTPTRSVPMYQADYEITVYELRTHDKVTKFDLAGANTSCPPVVGSTDDRIYSWPTGAQWHAVLDAHVRQAG